MREAVACGTEFERNDDVTPNDITKKCKKYAENDVLCGLGRFYGYLPAFSDG